MAIESFDSPASLSGSGVHAITILLRLERIENLAHYTGEHFNSVKQQGLSGSFAAAARGL
jgi:hypothetical protein